MHLLPSLAILTVATSLGVSAVNIELYASKDCTGTLGVNCSGIVNDNCCNGYDGDVYGSALFAGLPTDRIPAMGSVFNYNEAEGLPCGNECNSGFGFSLCLSCDDDITGALWSLPVQTSDPNPPPPPEPSEAAPLRS